MKKTQQERMEEASEIIAYGTFPSSFFSSEPDPWDRIADELCDVVEYPDLPELARELRVWMREDCENETEVITNEPTLGLAAKIFEWFWRVQEDDCFCNEFAQENSRYGPWDGGDKEYKISRSCM
jgi:hypothetical protein